MSVYPKHYLAEVPQELRLRVLDLCIHRQWHDALDLLHQNGFNQYEWYELVWFHDHAPTNLEPLDRNADSLSALDCVGLTLLPTPHSEISGTKSEIVPSFGVPPSDGPIEESETLTPKANRNAAVPCSSALSATSVLKSRPRSKIARLPQAIKTNLNTMLARGCLYMDIIRTLNAQGYPGFNKANLNAWKKTGFQHWLRDANNNAFVEGRAMQVPQCAGKKAEPPVTDQKPVVTDTNA